MSELTTAPRSQLSSGRSMKASFFELHASSCNGLRVPAVKVSHNIPSCGSIYTDRFTMSAGDAFWNYMLVLQLLPKHAPGSLHCHLPAGNLTQHSCS